MLHETLEYLGIAFISSVLLIIMSKIILQALIRRPADYYNARELREEELMLNAGGISITSEHETNPEGEIMQETHLEAQLGDVEPAEPEEIMLEIPDAIAESIEVHKEEDEAAEEEVAEEPAEVEEEPVTEAAEETSEEPAEVEEEPVTEDAEETAEEEAAEEEPVTEAEEETAEEPAEVEEEPVTEEAEETVPEADEEPVAEAAEETEEQAEEEIIEEPAPEEPAAEEPVITEEPKTPEEAFGFSIKAKTSRTKKPKKREEEEAAEELEEAKAAMDEARARAEEREPVSEWTESYAEIRDSLEKAFTERKHKPSMHMNKQELIDIASEMGIELPRKITKREILDLIKAAEDQGGNK